MENFNLKKYLTKNPLLEQSNLYTVFKITDSENKPFFGKSYKITDGSKYLNYLYSISNAPSTVDKTSTHGGSPIQRAMMGSELTDWKVEVIGTGLDMDASQKLISQSKSSNPDNYNELSGRSGEVRSKTKTITLPKSDSLAHNDEYYIAASKLNNYPELKDKVDMKSKLDHPIKGLYYKLLTNKVNRI